MNIDAQIATLKQRHQALERAIDEETQRPLPDSMALQGLKRHKLRVKDEITRMAAASGVAVLEANRPYFSSTHL